MNVERILALADLIEKQPHTDIEAEHGFTMNNWTHDCGTPACIAGWAYAMKIGGTDAKIFASDITVSASEYLGIDRGQGYALFEPELPGWENVAESASDLWDEITPSQAAATLRHLAKTGEVDWSISPVAAE